MAVGLFMSCNMSIYSCIIEQDKNKKEFKEKTPAQFIFQKKIVLDYSHNDPIFGYIYLDPKSGVKYLYMREANEKGGPAITRYWESKDECK